MTRRSAGLSLLAAATLAGCGSTSASLRDLRQDADRICRHTNHAFDALTSPGSPAQDSAFLSSGATDLEAQLRALRAQGPPRDGADVYRAALDALSREVSALRGAVAAIHRGEDPALAYRTLGARLAPLRTQANDAWQALGIADCLQ